MPCSVTSVVRVLVMISRTLEVRGGIISQASRYLGGFHIPSNLVVDHWTSAVESSSPLDFLSLHVMWTPFGRLRSYQIMSTISVGCDFTTQSGGIWDLQVWRTGRVADRGGPAFRSGHHDVTDRVFHIIVGIEVLGMQTGERCLDVGVGCGNTGIGAQVIAEQQRVPLIGPACLADMDVRGPLARWLAEVQFAPCLRRVRAPRRHVIAGVSVPEVIAEGRERSHQRPFVQRRDRDLHIDDIFGRQARDRRRADVIDAQCQGAQSRAQGRPELPELQGPLRIVGRNDDEILHASSLCAIQEQGNRTGCVSYSYKSKDTLSAAKKHCPHSRKQCATTRLYRGFSSDEWL